MGLSVRREHRCTRFLLSRVPEARDAVSATRLTADGQHPTRELFATNQVSLHPCKAQRLWRRPRHRLFPPMVRGPHRVERPLRHCRRRRSPASHASPPRTLPCRGRQAPGRRRLVACWPRLRTLLCAEGALPVTVLTPTGLACVQGWAPSGRRSPLRGMREGYSVRRPLRAHNPQQWHAEQRDHADHGRAHAGHRSPPDVAARGAASRRRHPARRHVPTPTAPRRIRPCSAPLHARSSGKAVRPTGAQASLGAASGDVPAGVVG